MWAIAALTQYKTNSTKAPETQQISGFELGDFEIRLLSQNRKGNFGRSP
jgi:hypothetical protein